MYFGPRMLTGAQGTIARKAVTHAVSLHLLCIPLLISLLECQQSCTPFSHIAGPVLLGRSWSCLGGYVIFEPRQCSSYVFIFFLIYLYLFVMLCRSIDKYSAEEVGVALLEERSDDDIFYNGRESCQLSASDYKNLTNTGLKKGKNISNTLRYPVRYSM